MATHDFGIMDNAPLAHERFDVYEPEKYHCIKIHDDHFETILAHFGVMKAFAHTLEIPVNGLVYCGITIIPPQSLTTFLDILTKQNNQAFEPLVLLVKSAIDSQKYMIHFGI